MFSVYGFDTPLTSHQSWGYPLFPMMDPLALCFLELRKAWGTFKTKHHPLDTNNLIDVT